MNSITTIFGLKFNVIISFLKDLPGASRYAMNH